ncbi:MAG: hypothetical protein ACYTEK_20740 [Planctomycetota bacterium]
MGKGSFGSARRCIISIGEPRPPPPALNGEIRKASSDSFDAGVLIPGFNDDYKGKAPDMGAFERGNPPLKFGRDAQDGITPAPWEEF